MVFKEKKDLLELYNAVNGTHYEDTAALTVTTLEDVFFIHYKLEEYAYFVAAARQYLRSGHPLEEALDLAIDQCLDHNKLADLLRTKRGEVKKLILTDFTREKYEKLLKKESYEDGARDKLKELVSKKLCKGKSIPAIAEDLEEEERLIRELAAEIQKEQSQALGQITT